MKSTLIALLLMVSASAFTQSRFSKGEFSINGFRAPSIGIEYRFRIISLHAGYYLTSFDEGITTNFIKTGLTAWFLPVGKREHPSSFYAGASYMRGLDHDYEDESAYGLEAGFRWMIWKGLNLRIGAIAVTGEGHDVEINPAGGLSYSFFFE